MGSYASQEEVKRLQEVAEEAIAFAMKEAQQFVANEQAKFSEELNRLRARIIISDGLAEAARKYFASYDSPHVLVAVEAGLIEGLRDALHAYDAYLRG